MKGKKLLAGVLSAAMVFSTMAISAFAAEGQATISAEESFEQAFKSNASTITLTGDVTVNTADAYSPVMVFEHDCTIDLAGYTLKKGSVTYIGVSNGANVKFTSSVPGGKINMGNTGDQTFLVKNGVLTFENITAEAGTSGENSVFVDTQFMTGTAAVNFDNCTLTLPGIGNVVRGKYGSADYDTCINIQDTTMESRNKTIWGGDSCIVGGNSTINGNVIDVVDVFKTGDNVTFGSYTGAKDLVATVTSSNGAVKGFDNFKDALAAATSNDTIKIYSDVTYSKHVSGANRVTKAKALDLNGKTLSLPDYDYNFGEITISNGTIESTMTTEAQGTALIFQCDKDPITFDGVTINTKDLSTGGYVIGTNGGKCVFKNSKMNVNPTTTTEIASLFSPGDHTSTSDLVIEDSEINVSNASTKIALWGNVEVKGSTKINADLTDNDGIRLNNYGSLKVTVTTDGEGNKKAPEINITTTGSNRYGINVADTTPYTVDGGAKVNTSVYRAPSSSNIADDEIKLSFEDVTVNEGEKVYDLYVEAASNKTINRLTTADLTFMLTDADTNKTPIAYEVFGTDKVSVQPDNAVAGKYMFYFNGLTAPSGTGVKVKVGQVKFNGYGKFSFKATAGEAHATTINGENVVTDFVAGTQLQGQGKFDITTELNDVEIKAPTRKLTVKIDFNNSVSAQSAEYTAMTVKVSGVGVSYEEKIGNITDNKTEVNFEDVLEKNKTYTVEVSGAGYRTARYTVTMTDDKTLNFWNNVKDNTANVEEGNNASAKNVTFLAGELVKDGQINIYDLSAVVSYFGTNNLVSAHPDYAKYDLNRDGKVDSKDVAYVLVSWGK